METCISTLTRSGRTRHRLHRHRQLHALADWRDDETHADADWGSIYNLDYLKANVAGGEGFDWYYDSPEGEAFQRREPITDGAIDEPWVFRTRI
jgi:hypothetical protein